MTGIISCMVCYHRPLYQAQSLLLTLMPRFLVSSKWAVVLQHQLYIGEWRGVVSHSPSDLPVSHSSRLFPCAFRDIYCDASYVSGGTRPGLHGCRCLFNTCIMYHFPRLHERYLLPYITILFMCSIAVVICLILELLYLALYTVRMANK